MIRRLSRVRLTTRSSGRAMDLTSALGRSSPISDMSASLSKPTNYALILKKLSKLISHLLKRRTRVKAQTMIPTSNRPSKTNPKNPMIRSKNATLTTKLTVLRSQRKAYVEL